jgi:hypothetical protein
MSNLTEKLVWLIVTALRSKEGRRSAIDEFQLMVRDRPNAISDFKVRQILLDLAYDLDYYEPLDEVRLEDASYYGDERLEQELEYALDRLRTAGVIVPPTIAHSS